MIKKIAVGGAAAALIVTGAASAAVLSTDDTTLAAGVVEVSGATLQSVSFDTDWIGKNNGTNPQETAPAVKEITFDFGTDGADLVVEGGFIGTDGKWKGYFGPDVAGDPENWTTDENGILVVDVTRTLFVEDLGGLNLNVYSG